MSHSEPDPEPQSDQHTAVQSDQHVAVQSGGISVSAAVAGMLSAFVGFFSSFAIVIQGLGSVGATPAQASSGLMAVTVAMGVCGIFLSLRYRMPISVAWSTPGAALLATSAGMGGMAGFEDGFAISVGAFLVSAVLVIMTGMWTAFGKLVAAIPATLAQAVLAGVLLPFCLAPFQAMATLPTLGIPVFVVWFVAGRVNRLLAMPAAVAVAVGLIAFTTDLSALAHMPLWTAPVPVIPQFSVAALFSIAIPLFIVTMTSQNITGMAVLNSFGYKPRPGPLFGWTGVFSLLAAPFGSHALNLAAITAALCAGSDVHPEPNRRYWSAVVAGGCYIVLGIFATVAVTFIELSPPILIRAVVGLALVGAFSNAMMGSLSEQKDREASIITFLITASGMTFLGIGGAFWGLLVGGMIYVWKKS